MRSRPSSRPARAVGRYPRFVQPRLLRPELRVFRVGDELIGFSLRSPDLDYRAALRSRLKPARVPQGAGRQILRLLFRRLGLDFAAADFMRDPRGGELPLPGGEFAADVRGVRCGLRRTPVRRHYRRFGAAAARLNPRYCGCMPSTAQCLAGGGRCANSGALPGFIPIRRRICPAPGDRDVGFVQARARQRGLLLRAPCARPTPRSPTPSARSSAASATRSS